MTAATIPEQNRDKNDPSYSEDTRYAIYYAPESGSGLDQFGQRWLGRNARTGAFIERPGIENISSQELEGIVAQAAFYGFHGTLKPPFFLSSPELQPRLIDAIQKFAAEESSFDLPKLALSRMGRFLALTLQSPSMEMNRLAERCVRFFDSFRRPPSDEELNRRRTANLTALQEQYLLKWGYPYVMDQFRFHLTLTGPFMDPEISGYLAGEISRQLAHLDLDHIKVSSICLFVQENVNSPFFLHSRYNFRR